MSLFDADIKNTRFFLTLVMTGGLFLFGMLDILIMVMQIPVNEVEFGLLNIIVGALITSVTTCYKAYFDDRQAVDTAMTAAMVTTKG